MAARVPLDAPYNVRVAIEDLNAEIAQLRKMLADVATTASNATLPVESLQRDVAFLKQLRRVPERGLRLYASSVPLFLNDNLDWDSPLANIPITSVSSDYTVLPGDYLILVDCTSGNKTVTFPLAAAKKGRAFEVKKIDSSANKVILAASGSDTIDGSTTQELLHQNEAAPVISDGVSTWRVV